MKTNIKKFAWMMALALPVGLTFTACGDDEEKDPEIFLNTQAVDIDWNKTTTLTSTEKSAVWSSSDDFIASVDDKGVVTANHVGEAIIKASIPGAEASCKVTVKATDSSFTRPILDFGASQSKVAGQVSGLVKNDEMSTADILFYGTTDAYGYPWYIYNFEKDALVSSSLTVEFVNEDSFNNLANYLDQYYQEVSYNEETLVYTYANAETVAKSTVIVRVSPNDEMTNLSAIFVPNDGTRSGNVEAAISRHLDIVNSVRK